MMMTLKENTINPISQSVDYNRNGINRSHSTMGYDYHHRHNPWEKPIHMSFDYQPTPYSFETMSSTGGISLLDSTQKLNNSYPSFDMTSNQNFYRRHTESALPISNSIFPTSTTNHPSSSPFNYSHTTAHYHPSDLFFGWNNGPSLMRTHSNASYQDYSQSTSFPCYNPINSSTSQSTNNKSTDSLSTSRIETGSINSHRTTNYPSYFDIIPSINVPLPPTQSSLVSSTNSSSSQTKHLKPSIKKRARLTAQLRNEILKLKTNQPTVFVWEIQQILLQNGICTSQTLPSAKVIQRVLNESKKAVQMIKEEQTSNVNLVMEKIFNKTSPITICLSPSQSSTLSDGESASECSICLETYRSGQEVSILSCAHEYHSPCIKEWMMKNRSCPMCRKDIHNQPQFVTLLI